MDQGVVATTSSGTATVNPTKTTTYTYMVNNSSVGLFQETVTVFVGAGTLSATQSTASSNYGPGVPLLSPQFATVEVTYTLSGAGCANYVPVGLTTTPCSGGTVSNPWEDVQGWAVFTGQNTGKSYKVGLFYEGGANSGTGNVWKFRFAPPVIDTWNYTATISDPTNYKTFSQTGLFSSIYDPAATGPLRLYGSGNNYLMAVASGAPFYPIAMNILMQDIGNGGAAGILWTLSIGAFPLPLTGGQVSVRAPQGAVSSFVQAGFNLFSIDDGGTQNISTIGAGINTNTYKPYGVGNTNGGSANAGGLALDSALQMLQQMRTHAQVTPESQPGSGPFNLGSPLNVFTSPVNTMALLHAWQYYINRWGAYTDIWNLENEQTTSPEFLNTLCLWIKQQDPYKHLISFGALNGGAVAGNQNLDISTPHLYAGTSSPGSVISVVGANETALAAIPNVPTLIGEFGTAGNDDVGVNFFVAASYWASFFQNVGITVFPDPVGNGESTSYISFVGTPQLLQLANLSSYASTFDPTATALSITVGNGSGGQTVKAVGLASAADAGIYVWNGTATQGTAAGATVTWTVPTAGMKCVWSDPITGATNSTFTTTGGSQQITVPTFTQSMVMRCRAPAKPVVQTVMLPSVLVGSSYSQVLSAVGGAGSPYTFSLVAGGLPPGVALSGATIGGTPTTAGYWNVSVQATDSSGARSVVQKFILAVIPAITVPISQLDNGTLNYPLNGYHYPIPVSGGAQPVTCTTHSLLPTGVSMNSYCGMSGTPTSPGSFPLDVTATDALGNTATARIAYAIPGTTAGIQTASLAGATSGFVYSTTVEERPSAGTVTWTVSSGTLCSGLGLITKTASGGNTGAVAYIAGTLLATSPCTFSLTATDSVNGASAPQSYTLAVNQAPSITTASLPAFSPGTAYNQSISATGGTPPLWYALTAGSLPPGFTLDSLAGVIYGIPQSGGSYPITITAWDANHAGASATYELSASTTLPAPSITSGGIVPVDSTVTTIQAGEWVSIYGTNLASSTATWTGNFPTLLGGTSVTIDGIPAYLSYVSPGQINLQAPNDTSIGSVPVVVTTASGTATSTVTLAQFAPAFLLLDSKHVTGIILRPDGSGAYDGGAYDIIGPTGNSLGYPTVAAKTGDTVELYAMGLGPTNPPVQAGQAFSSNAPTTNTVNLLINKVSVVPRFAGFSSSLVDQINLTIPAGIGTGDVPLVATVGGVQTQSGVVISLQ